MLLLWWTKYLGETVVLIWNSGKSLVSQELFASVKKNSFWEEDWTLCYSSMRFWYFRDSSQFSKNLSFKLFNSSFRNLYIPWLLLIITLHFTCVKKMFKHQKVTKYHDHDCFNTWLCSIKLKLKLWSIWPWRILWFRELYPLWVH